MRIYLTKIAKEESKTNVYAGCCVNVVDLSKAKTGFTYSLDLSIFELWLSRRSFPHLQPSMQR